MRHQSAIAWSALVLLLAVPAAHAQQTAQAGVITALKPRDFIRRGQQPPQEAARGDQILWEDIIQTERGGRVRIGLLDGSILNIGSEAGVQILRHDAATQQSEVLLNFGKMRALVRELGRPDSKFEVRTNTAVAGVIGTDEFIDASNPAYTCALSLGGVIFLRSDDLSIPGIEVLYPGEKSCVEEGRAPEPKRPATDEELQDAVHSTAPTEISLQPAVAFPGTTVSAELTGQNLLPLESLTVSGEGVNATPLLEEATPTRIPLRIEVSPDASPGLRLITLRTPAGEESVDFVVLPPPGVGLALDLSPLTTLDTPFVLLRPGPQGPFQVTARFEGPSPGPVTFTLVGLPPGISHSFTAPQALPGQTIQLYFELTGDVSPGDYVAALGARAGLFAAAAAIYLRVPPPAGTPVIEVEVEHYPSPEQPPEILTGTEFRVWQGARLVFDASASSVPGGELTGFTWQVVNTPVGAAGPRFELDTWQLTPGTYRILLQATSNFGTTAQQEFRLAVLALPNPDEVPFGLGRAIETLQVNEYMKWFHLVLFRDYPGLEERTRNSFQQLNAARVYVRLDNRQVSRYDAFYQVTYEIEFSTRDNPEQSQRRRESVTLRVLFLPREGVWRIVDFAVTVSEIPGELILATLELTTDPPTSETTPLELAPGETTELHLTVSSDTVAGLVNLTAAAPPGLTVGFGSSQVPVNSATDVFLTASPDAAAGLNQVLVAGQTSAVGGSVPIFLNITARPAVPILNVNPTSLDFGGVPVGTPAEQIVTVTNIGTADLFLTDATISGSSAFSLPLDPEITPPVTVLPGASVEFDVHFLPTAPGPVTGTLTIVSSNAGAATVSLSGTGISAGAPAITVSPTSLDFGSVLVGSSNSASVTITNTGTADLLVTSIGPSGSPAFLLTLPSLPSTVSPGASISFNVQFVPLDFGPASATVTIESNAGSGQVALAGTGLSPEITVSTQNLDFGNVTVNTTSPPQSFSISNTGNADLIVNSITVDNPVFAAAPSLTLPATLVPSASMNVQVTFAPSALGSATGTLQIFSNDPGSPLPVALTGSGISAAGPVLSVNPTSVDFGDVLVGTTSLPIGVTVMNTGTADLSVNSIFFTGSSAFVLSAPLPSFPVVLPPGGSFNVDHTFSPSGTGPASGTMTVSSDAGTVDVPFTGNGISGAVIQLIEREIVGSSLLDPLPQNSFPRGGSYRAFVRGSGLAGVTGFQSSRSEVSGSVLSATDTQVDLFVSTPPVPEGQTGQAPIPAVGFSLLSAAGSISSGSVTLDIVAGPAPVVQNLQVTNGVTSIPRGSPTRVEFAADVLSAGNIQFFFVGCGSCVVEFLGTTGTQFSTMLLFAITWDIPFDFASFGSNVVTGGGGAVDGAGQRGDASMDLPVTGPAIGLSTTSINFGDVGVGSSGSDSFAICNNGNADLIVNNITVDNTVFTFSPSLTLPGTVVPSTCMSVLVGFNPVAAGPASGTLTIDSNAGMPTVSLSGNGVSGGAQISVSPPTLAFGNVVVGASSTLDVTISNVGSADLMISDISTSCGAPAIPFECGFQPETTGFSFPLTIPPGGVPITLSVTYQPSCAPCSDSDDLQISSNDPANPTVSVPLTGNGVAAPVISSVFAGSPIEGATASITGSGFSTVLADNTVLFTDVKGTQAAVTPTTATSTSMEFTIPSGKVAGGATVQVSVSGVLSNQVSFDLHPHLLTISPSSGPVGTTVTITGTSFDTVLGTGFGTPGTSIVFGGSLAATVLSATNTDVQFQVPTGLGTGIKSVAAIVNSRGSDNDQIFTVTGPAIQVNPTSLDFPNVPEGASSTQNLTISNIGNLNLTITNIDEAISCDGSGFCEDDSAALPYPKVLTPGSSIIVPVTYSPFSAPSSDSSSINISSDDPSTPFLSVPLTGNSLVAFTLSPIFHDFGLVPVGMSSSPLTVTITNTSGTTLNITDIFSSPTTVFVVDTSLTNTSLGPGATTTFDVTFILASPGEVSGFILINTDLVTKSLSVHGEAGVAGTGFTVTPSPVDFGAFTLGSSSPPATFTISNFTLVPLTVNSVTSTDFQFTVAGAPTVVPASSDGITPGTATFTVTYTASLEGRTEAGIRTETPLGVEYCEVIGTGIAPVPIRIAESGEEPPPQAPGEPAPDDSADPVRSSIHRRGQTNRQIRGGSLPELLVRAEEVRQEPRRVRPGETVRFRVPVHNRGGGAAAGVVVEFAIPELGLRHRETVDLASGERVVLVFEIEFSADDLRRPLRPEITVDPDGQFQEARRDNNVARLRPLAAVGGPGPLVGRRGNRLQRARLVVSPGDCVGFNFRGAQTACGRDADIELSIAADGFTPILRAAGLEAVNAASFEELGRLPDELRATELAVEPGRLLVVRPRSGAPVLVQVRAVRRTSAVRAPGSGRPRQVDVPRTRRFPAEPTDLPTQEAGSGVLPLVQVVIEWTGGR